MHNTQSISPVPVLAGSMLASPCFSASVLAYDALIIIVFSPLRRTTFPPMMELQGGKWSNQPGQPSQFKDHHCPAFANFIEQGWLEVTVARPLLSICNPGYIEA